MIRKIPTQEQGKPPGQEEEETQKTWAEATQKTPPGKRKRERTEQEEESKRRKQEREKESIETTYRYLYEMDQTRAQYGEPTQGIGSETPPKFSQKGGEDKRHKEGKEGTEKEFFKGLGEALTRLCRDNGEEKAKEIRLTRSKGRVGDEVYSMGDNSKEGDGKKRKREKEKETEEEEKKKKRKKE